MEIVNRKIETSEDVYDSNAFENAPMTTWHNDFEEGFWFATTVACHETIPINLVVCLNPT